MKLIISGILLLLSTQTLAQCLIKLRVTHFPPYAIEQNNQYSGMDIELANLLLKEANCQIEYINQPWKRALYLLKNGGLDLVTGMSITEQREQYVHFVGPMRNEEMALIVANNSDLSIDSLDSIAGLTKAIGITRGLFYGKALTDKLQQDKDFAKHFDFSDATHVNVLKLIKDRLSGVIGDRYYMTEELRKHNLADQYKIAPFTIHKNEVYFGFSKKSVSQYNLKSILEAHQRLSDSGAYQTVIDQY
jgi:ABC-type amino acid transport substrate-binding protein